MSCRSRIALAGLVGAALLAPPLVATAPRVAGHSAAPVVLELFTSQGCSSCPPADRLAARLAREPGLVVITRPVTYWDRLGWQDTLGKAENTELQRAYAARGGPGAGVYTPQVVVDGGAGAVGSREGAIRALIRAARAAPRPHLALARGEQGGLGIAIAGAVKDAAEVVLVALDSSEKVAIGRGENGGRSVTYTNVFLGERRVATWSGGAHGYPVPASDLAVASADSYAVLVRAGPAGPILAAAMVPLR